MVYYLWSSIPIIALSFLAAQVAPIQGRLSVAPEGLLDVFLIGSYSRTERQTGRQQIDMMQPIDVGTVSPGGRNMGKRIGCDVLMAELARC